MEKEKDIELSSTETISVKDKNLRICSKISQADYLWKNKNRDRKDIEATL